MITKFSKAWMVAANDLWKRSSSGRGATGFKRSTKSNRINLILAAAAGVALAGFGSSANAATLFWWASGTTTQGGSGFWDTTTTDWRTVSSPAGNADSTWTPNDGTTIANFGGPASTVTLNTTVNVASMSFVTNNNYTVSGSGTLTMAGPNFNVNPSTAGNPVTTVNVVVAGSAGLTKVGTGTLVLNAANSYTGTTTVNVGTLQFSTVLARVLGDVIVNPSTSAISPTVFAISDPATGGGTRAASVTLNQSTMTYATTTSSGTSTITNALTLNGGDIVKVSPASATVDTLTFGSLSRSAGSTVAFSSTSASAKFGNTVSNGSDVKFTTAPTLSGVGALNTTQAGVLASAIVTDNLGTGFATYDTSTPSWTGGIRALSAAGTAETTNTFASNVNVKVAASSNDGAGGFTVNSLDLDNGNGAFITLTLSNADTVASGGVLSVGTTTGNNITGAALGFGSTEAIIHTVGDLTISSQLTGTGGLTKADAGTLLLNNTGTASTLTGPITVNAGTLKLGSANGVFAADPTTTLTVNSGTFDVNGQTQTVASLGNLPLATLGAVTSTVAGGVLIVNNSADAVYSAKLTGAANFSLVKSGGGNLTLAGGNTYTGGTTINAGTLTAGSTTALGNGTGNVTFGTSAAETLDLNNFNNNIGQLVGGDSTHGVITNNAAVVGTATLNLIGTGTQTFAGVIKDGSTAKVALTVGSTLAAGTQTLSGTNTYTGATLLSGGTLIVAGAGSINNTSSITLTGTSSTAKFLYNSSVPETAMVTITKGTIGGNGTISAVGGVSIATNAIISPGNSPAAQQYTTGVTFASGGTYKWEVNDATGAAGTGFDQLQVTGGLNVNAGFKIDITGLTAVNAAGVVPDFDSTQTYAWLIASSDSLNTYSASDFTLLTTNFANNNPLNGGSFAIHIGTDSFAVPLDGSANDLYLTFSGVPEPASLALLGLGAAAILARRRRRS